MITIYKDNKRIRNVINRYRPDHAHACRRNKARDNSDNKGNALFNHLSLYPAWCDNVGADAYCIRREAITYSLLACIIAILRVLIVF